MKRIVVFLVAIAVLGVVAAAGFANNSIEGFASYEPVQSEIIIHYGNGSVEVLTPGVPEFGELWESMRSGQ